MSIINEALKKTELSIQKNEAVKDTASNGKTGKRPILLYIFILIAGLFLGNLIFSLLAHKAHPANIIKAAPSVQPTPSIQQQIPNTQTLTSTASLPKQDINVAEPSIRQKPDFVLNGIFVSDNDGYALVNNQIVRENETVDGAKVKKITATSVELDLEGVITTLSTRR
jgi:type II secretory pathway component PulC